MTSDVFSSQQDRNLLNFVVKVTLASHQEAASVLVDCVGYRNKEIIIWYRSKTGVFRCNVQTLCESKYPYTGMAEAKREAALYFWEITLLKFFRRKSIAVTPRVRRNICLAAQNIARSFSKNYGFPPGFLIEAKPLLPETIERCDWDGARERIMGRWPTDIVHTSSKTNKK